MFYSFQIDMIMMGDFIITGDSGKFALFFKWFNYHIVMHMGILSGEGCHFPVEVIPGEQFDGSNH